MSDNVKHVEEYPPHLRITMAMPFKESLYIPDIPRPVFIRFNEMCEATAKTGYEVYTNTETTTSNTPLTRTLIVNKMVGDWLLMMDADAFPQSADAANRLLAVAKEDPQNLKKIVAAPSVRVRFPFMSSFGNFNKEGMAIPWRYGHEYTDEDVEAMEMRAREVEWTGFHFVLIHRTVFEAVAFPWFQLGVPDEETGITYGHDIRFCRLAKRAGFKTYIDYSCRVGHYTIRPVTLADQRMAILTNANAKYQMDGLDVDVENLRDDDDSPLNYTIPVPGEKVEGRPLIPVKVPEPDDGIIMPKEALQ